jgi:hypothetical protein
VSMAYGLLHLGGGLGIIAVTLFIYWVIESSKK